MIKIKKKTKTKKKIRTPVIKKKKKNKLYKTKTKINKKKMSQNQAHLPPPQKISPKNQINFFLFLFSLTQTLPPPLNLLTPPLIRTPLTQPIPQRRPRNITQKSRRSRRHFILFNQRNGLFHVLRRPSFSFFAHIFGWIFSMFHGFSRECHSMVGLCVCGAHNGGRGGGEGGRMDLKSGGRGRGRERLLNGRIDELDVGRGEGKRGVLGGELRRGREEVSDSGEGGGESHGGGEVGVKELAHEEIEVLF